MSEREPLPPDLEKLLDAERDYPVESGDRQARVKAAVISAVALGAVAAPAQIAASKAVAASAIAKSGIGVGAAISIATATFFVGGVTAVVVDRSLREEPAHRAPAPTVETPTVETPTVTTPADAGAPLLEPTAPTPLPPEPALAPSTQEATHTNSAPREGHRATLAREREIIDVARASLVRGNSSDALQALERHRRQFPDGQLAEERDALRIQAIANTGDWQRARAEARMFHIAYPRSLFSSAVDAAVTRAISTHGP